MNISTRRTLVPIVDFTAKNIRNLVIHILIIWIMNYHVILHFFAIYMILKGYRQIKFMSNSIREPNMVIITIFYLKVKCMFAIRILFK